MDTAEDFTNFMNLKKFPPRLAWVRRHCSCDLSGSRSTCKRNRDYL